MSKWSKYDEMKVWMMEQLKSDAELYMTFDGDLCASVLADEAMAWFEIGSELSESIEIHAQQIIDRFERRTIKFVKRQGAGQGLTEVFPKTRRSLNGVIPFFKSDEFWVTVPDCEAIDVYEAWKKQF